MSFDGETMVDGSGRFREAFDDLDISLTGVCTACDCTEKEGGVNQTSSVKIIHMQIITPMHLLHFAGEDKEVHCDSHRSLE